MTASVPAISVETINSPVNSFRSHRARSNSNVADAPGTAMR